MSETAAQGLPGEVAQDSGAIAESFALLRLIADQQSDETGALRMIWRTITDALRTIRICIGRAIRLIFQRIFAWIDRRIVRSLHVAWSFGTIGWGGFIGICLYQYWRW